MPYRTLLPLWNKLQLQHFVNSLLGGGPLVHTITAFEMCFTGEQSRHGISRTYAFLSFPVGLPDPLNICEWEGDQGMSFTDHQKQKMLTFALKSSISSTTQESSFKILVWW